MLQPAFIINQVRNNRRCMLQPAFIINQVKNSRRCTLQPAFAINNVNTFPCRVAKAGSWIEGWELEQQRRSV